MATFQIRGARKETGENVNVQVESADALQAELLANHMGIMVERVIPIVRAGPVRRAWQAFAGDTLRAAAWLTVAGLFLATWAALKREEDARAQWKAFLHTQERVRYHAVHGVWPED